MDKRDGQDVKRSGGCRFCGGPIPPPVKDYNYKFEKLYCSKKHRIAFHTMQALNKKSSGLRAERGL